MTKLRIVKRNDKYVVQIGVKRWWTNKIKWKDKQEYHKKYRSWWQPYPLNHYPDFESADQFCKDFLRPERKNNDCVVKTYNTGLNDAVFRESPDMPRCKPHKNKINILDRTVFCDNCHSQTLSVRYLMDNHVTCFCSKCDSTAGMKADVFEGRIKEIDKNG